MKLLIFGIILCIIGCSKTDKDEQPVFATMVPFWELGDTLRNDNNTTAEHITIVIDSGFQYKIDITSTHDNNSNAATYFVKVEPDKNEKIKILDSLASGGVVFKGPILSTFFKGDHIDFNIAEEAILDWFPTSDIQSGNSGWLKYHIYTPFQGLTIKNIKPGENYIVIKFGEIGKEKMAWLNVVYQDTLIYIKEGYYRQQPNQGIVVGIN